MNSSNVYHINSTKQDRRDGKFTMQGLALTNFIHSIIREYGKYSDNSYAVDVNNLDLSDKKLVISHLESAEWYEWACESPSHTETLFSENAIGFQKMVDRACYDVYAEDMEEMGMRLVVHPNNDEHYWVRR